MSERSHSSSLRDRAAHSLLHPQWRRPALAENLSLTPLFEFSWDGKIRDQLAALQQEPERELQAEGLLRLAANLAVQQKVEASARLLHFLENNLANERAPWAQALRGELAQQGKKHGAEIFLGRLVTASTDPATLASFAAGGALGECARFATLARLGRGAPALWTRGIAAKLLGGIAGTGVEVAAFGALRPGATSPQEWKSLALNFALLRGVSGLPWPRLGKAGALLEGGALLAGAGLARYAGGFFAWQAPTDASGALRESLEFLLGARIAGHFSRSVFGKTLSELNLRLASRGSEPGAKPFWGDGSHPFQALAVSGKWPARLAPKASVDSPREAGLMFTKGSGPDRSFLERRWRQRFRSELGPRLRLNSEALQRIFETFQKTRFSVDPEWLQNRYGNLLVAAKVEPVSHESGEISREQILERAVQAFEWVSRLDPLRRGSASLYEHFLQTALEKTLRSGDQNAFNVLLRSAGLTRDITELTDFLGDFHPLHESLLTGTSGLSKDMNHRIQRLPLLLDKLVRPELYRYLKCLAGGGLLVYPNGRHETLVKSDFAGIEVLQPWTAEAALKGLETFFMEFPPGTPQSQALGLGWVLTASDKFGIILMDRICKLLALKSPIEKLVEISRLGSSNSWKPLDFSELKKASLLDPLKADFSEAAKALNATLFTGFVDDPILAAKLARIYSLAEHYRNADQIKNHRQDTLARARELLESREQRNEIAGKKVQRSTFNSVDVLEMLYLHPTQLATQAREAILSRKEVGLEVAGPERFRELWTSIRHPGQDEPPPAGGFYVDAAHSPSGKPFIVIRELDRTLSRDEKIRHAVELPANVVHEFEHHLQQGVLDFNDPRQAAIAEMRSKAESLFFHLRQGNDAEWELMESLSPYGLGLYLRNWTEIDFRTRLNFDDTVYVSW